MTKMNTSKLKKTLAGALAPKGKYVSIDDGSLELSSERLVQLKNIVEAGGIKPFIDRSYPLEKIVEAHEYVGKGHKKGGEAITVVHNGN